MLRVVLVHDPGVRCQIFVDSDGLRQRTGILGFIEVRGRAFRCVPVTRNGVVMDTNAVKGLSGLPHHGLGPVIVIFGRTTGNLLQWYSLWHFYESRIATG